MGPETRARELHTAVSELLVRYATAIDTRDWTLFRSCFTEDCAADYGDYGSWDDLDSLVAWMEEVHARFGHTMHRITNVRVREQDGSVRAHSYVDAVLLLRDTDRGVQTLGTYDDTLVPTDEGWRIARRRFTRVRQGALPEGQA